MAAPQQLQPRIAVYPGTFDPVSFGHLDLIERGSRLFDELIVAVAINIEKQPWFTAEERIGMIRESVADRGLNNVTVESFSGMIVDFVRAKGSRVLYRGIRTLSDWESEFQMALANRELATEVETVFVMASLEFSYISSRLIREAASLGGRVEQFVPAPVARRMRELLVRRQSGQGGPA